MKTFHFVGEWFDCCAPGELLTDPSAIRARCMAHVARRHLPIRYEHFTASAADGVIGEVTGNGIHLVVRTFPRRHAVVADLFVDQCEHPAVKVAMQVLDDVRDEFRPLRALLHRLPRRGQSLPMPARAPRKPTEVFFASPVRGAV